MLIDRHLERYNIPLSEMRPEYWVEGVAQRFFGGDGGGGGGGGGPDSASRRAQPRLATSRGCGREAEVTRRDVERRQKVQADFDAGKIDLIVANDAFGLGIDKSDVRTVHEVFPPRALESLVNQWGRAGRDGGDAECVLYWRPQDFDDHEARERPADPRPNTLCALRYKL